jgi:hypothetical protein
MHTVFFFLSLFFLSTHKKYFFIFRVHERVQYVTCYLKNAKLEMF